LLYPARVSQLSCLAVAPLVLALVACGGKAAGNAGDGDGQGGTGTGGTSNGGGPSKGGAAACAKYDDESPAFVSVDMINKTNLPIYLGQSKVTLVAASTVTLDESYGVYPTSNGSSNPSPGAGAGPSGNSALLRVQLVFTN
jgi:hypothetical protein